MEWIAHRGWLEQGAAPNSPQSLLDGTSTNFRLEFDLLWDREKVLVAHDTKSATGFLLAEALQIVAEASNGLSLDIKNSGGEKEISSLLEKFAQPERILLCGHDIGSLQKIEGPYLRGWSFPGPRESLDRVLEETAAGEVCDGFMLHYSLATPERVLQIQEWGGWVHAWTLDNLEDFQNLGPVDGVTSNRPQALQSLF